MIFNSFLTAGLLLLLTAIRCSSEKIDTESTPKVMVCPDLNPQKRLDWSQIIGKWYVVEVVKHSIDPHPISSSRVVVETCPIVKLQFAEQSNSPSNIKLLWTEHAGDLDYSFAIPSRSEPGRWIPDATQNGTLVTKGYVQFDGIVQIMKAVETHMVLTFCSTTPDNKKYSIILSKKRYLPETETKSIQELLSLRGLTIVVIQETCNNSGNRKELNNVVQWMTLLVAIASTASQVFATSDSKKIKLQIK